MNRSWVLGGLQTVLEVVQLELGAEEILPVIVDLPEAPVERCPVLTSLHRARAQDDGTLEDNQEESD